MTVVDLGGFQGLLGDALFEGCSNLKAIIFRSEDTLDLHIDINNPFANLVSTCYIYVPSKHLDSIKGQFPNIASKVRALEDYTVDNTIEGELVL
jgi:hypothetical protein